MIEQIPPIADRMWMPRSAREKQRGFLINPYMAAGPSGPSDPYFANVVLLMHGQTLLLDSSGYGRPVTKSGAGVALTSSNPKWGTNSINCTGDRLYVPHSTDFDAGSADMTCESWVNFNSSGIGGRCYMCGNQDSTGAHGTYGLYKLTTDVLHGYVVNSGGGGVDGGAAASAVLNTWAHVAISKNGTTLRHFVNGVQQGTAGTVTGGIIASYGTVRFAVGGLGEDIGTYGGPYGDRMCGQMADFRLTIGVGRYTSNFTPPTAQFPDH